MFRHSHSQFHLQSSYVGTSGSYTFKVRSEVLRSLYKITSTVSSTLPVHFKLGRLYSSCHHVSFVVHSSVTTHFVILCKSLVIHQGYLFLRVHCHFLYRTSPLVRFLKSKMGLHKICYHTIHHIRPSWKTFTGLDSVRDEKNIVF